MSWWDRPEGWILGDRPADLVEMAFDELPAKPSLQAVLDAVAAVLARRQPGGEAVQARLEGGGSLVARPSAAVPELVARLSDAFDQIDEAYQERWQRPAQPGERLATLNFVLAGESRYFAETGDRPLSAFVAG